MKKIKITPYFHYSSWIVILPTIRFDLYYKEDFYLDIEFEWLKWYCGFIFNEIKP